MSAISDALKKKVDVELLYNSVQFGDQTSWSQVAVEKANPQQREPSGLRLNTFGDQISWSQDAVEKASTQQRGPSSPRLRVGDQTSWRKDAGL